MVAAVVRAVEAQMAAPVSVEASAAKVLAAEAATAEPLTAAQILANAAYAMIPKVKPDHRTSELIKMI
jgi:hypothetical protein